MSEKPWADALRRAAAVTDEATKKKRLLLVAEKVFAMAIAGDLGAVREIGDRLDGKAAQDTTLTIEKREAVDWTREELVAMLRIRNAAEAQDDEDHLVIEHEPIKKIA